VTIGFFLDDDLGAQFEFGRFTLKALDVTNTSKDSRPEYQYYTANVLRELIFPAITADDEVAVLGLAQTFTNKTLTTPTIAATGWTNANHAHAAANSGGQIPIANTTGTLLEARGGTGDTDLDDIVGTTDEISVAAGANAIIGGDVTLTVPDVFKPLYLPVGGINPAAGDLTGVTALADDADNTNDFTIDQIEFSASAENYWSFVYPMPDDWDASTAPKFQIITYSEGSHASNTAEYTMATGYIRPGSDSWVAALGTAVNVTQVYDTVDRWETSTTFSPTPAGTAGANCFIKVKGSRDGDDGTNDTFASTTRMVYLIMYYKKTIYGDETDI